MKIAFYAPLKSPLHPVPSGDRRMARLLMAALEQAGHTVTLASELRCYDGIGEAERQLVLTMAAQAETARIEARWDRDGAPDVWFTYHCYHKAPDLLGPDLARRYGLPYLIAEPSDAPSRAAGPWGVFFRAARDAIEQADALFCLTREDLGMVRQAVSRPAKAHYLPPFTDLAPFDRVAPLTGEPPLLLAVGMMRGGDKLASYRLLATALADLGDLPWRLAVVGDGEERGPVEAAMVPFGDRVTWHGAVETGALPALYAGADLMVWPAVNEAYGMALLEAQASGLPVVAGAEHGVPDIVRDGRTGWLAPPRDAAGFAARLRQALGDPAARRAAGQAARQIVVAEHGVAQAAALLDAVIQSLRP
jgi:glycosyltransferase involved in cell wall biosynthesis